jgi:hypothetical protein
MTGSGGVAPLEHLAVEPFPSADLVLLCSFGPDLDRTRTDQELRAALRSAGYGASLGRHLILTSPMLRRLRGNRFTLHRSPTMEPPDERSPRAR